MLDLDLAFLYGVETKALNRAVDRNIGRFPDDFAFRISQDEWKVLKCQIGTSKTGSGGKQKLPRVFTEFGAYAAAFTLRSPCAQTMSIHVIRAFVRMRQVFTAQEKMGKTVEEIRLFVLKHSNQTDREFRKVWNAIEKLAEPPTSTEPMGFKLKY